MKKFTGFTLIELLVSTALGIIIIAATISIYVATAKGNTSTVESARLNHDLGTVMSIMVNDLRRAGYWGGAVVDADSTNNPFTQTITNIRMPTSDCILYTYDADADGTVDRNEYYGFKLDNGSILMRLSVTVSAAAAPTTTNTNCSAGTWRAVSDGDIVQITAISFDDTGSKCLNVTDTADWLSSATPCVASSLAATAMADSNDRMNENRRINISVSAQVVDDSAVTATLNETIKVRNNYVFFAI